MTVTDEGTQPEVLEKSNAVSDGVKASDGESRWLHAFAALPVGIAIVDRQYSIQFMNSAARRMLGIYGVALKDDLIHLVQNYPNRELRSAIDRVFLFHEETRLPVSSYSEPPDPITRFLQVSCQSYEINRSGKLLTYAVVLTQDVTRFEQRAIDAERGAEEHLDELAAMTEQLNKLYATAEELRRANDDLTADNMELRSVNEEFVIANEELQSGTEEVETLNEELQASNEELETLNEELQATVEELNATNDDLHARSVEIRELADNFEQARRVSELERSRLDAVLAGMGDAVMVVDSNGETLLANRSFEAQFDGRASGSSSNGQDRGDTISVDILPVARAKHGEAFAMEFSNTAPDGSQRYFEVVGRPIGVGADIDGGVLVIRNITDRSLRRLQDQFIAVASHELRTPLTVLKGYLTLLNRPGYETSQRATFLQMADQQAGRMERLIYDLLDVTRLQSGHLSLRKTPLNLVDGISRAVDTVSGLYPDREIRMQQRKSDFVVEGDPERLEQVFLNLLLNAIRFTPDGGQVTVRVRKSGKTVSVTVTDNGPGIDPTDLPRIFTRFFRSESQSNRESGGLGLGLYISRELVRLHDGDIDVRSQLGAGASFTVKLPLQPSAQTPADSGSV